MSFFSDNLKRLRTEKGYSQAALADKIGVSQNAVYNWENGKREPRSDQRERIAEIFQISEVALMYGMSEAEYLKFQNESRKRFAEQWNAQRQLTSFTDKYETLNEKGKKKVIEYIDDIKGNPEYRKDDTP